MKTKYKHIWFRDDSEDHPKRKTKTFSCFNHTDCFLGEVRWFSSWRQYCFITAEQGSVMNLIMAKSCLDDVSSFISQLMEARKK